MTTEFDAPAGSSSVPAGKPGTVQTPSAPRPMPSALPQGWPRISVITPSYNQGQYLEKTICSVIDQGYPNLEYLVIDGNSTDNSQEILRRYGPSLSYWISEPDRGQCEAINKGLRRATGEIVAWLNSDDTYLSDTLAFVGAFFAEHPAVEIVFGSALFIDEEGRTISRYEGVAVPYFSQLTYWRGWHVPQPTLFVRRQLMDRFGMLDENFQLALDYEWMLRIGKQAKVVCHARDLATYRRHTVSKTGDWQASKHRFYAECDRAVRKNVARLSPLYWRWLVARSSYSARLALGRYRRRRSA